MTTNIHIIWQDGERFLRIEGPPPEGLSGKRGGLYPTTPENAEAIRQAYPWAAPQRVGLRKSIGLGDRLGIATPGHLRAVAQGDMFPVLAQQSMREMARARRSPRDVLDDVTWGVVEAGWRGGYATDADHLKTTADIDHCVAAGYLGFTLDPGAYVDDAADTDATPTLRDKITRLDWNALQTTPEQHAAHHTPTLTEREYLMAAAKYGAAMAHVARLNAHLENHMGHFDLEVSVDETDSVTTLAQHRYIVSELQRMGIAFIGIAPRFVGAFEKGVDYIGDLDTFREDYAQHAALARKLGPYKLSIHSGSDKFSIYPIIATHSGDAVHLKTSGTSWVEALRVIARHDEGLFKQIFELAKAGYAENRASYHVTGEVENIPPGLPPEATLDQFDAREVLHVSFGPVLAAYHDDITTVLRAHLSTYWAMLAAHFAKHIQPFYKEVTPS
jgi:hypothetical protein